MLKVPEHQVAGHQAIDGNLGPLVDDSGRFYKPLQANERGTKELAFYQSLFSDTLVPDHIRRFFPVFYGSQLLEASDGSGLRPHLVLQDLASNHLNPSILDVKMGSRTWYPEASDDYIQRCLEKDRTTTSVSLGFRISGLQIYQSKESGFWKSARKDVLSFTADNVRLVLRKFVSSNSSVGSNAKLDCCFARSVYGGPAGVLEQLLELKTWFEDQTIYHFNSTSLLILFDEESLLKGRTPFAEVKLIDFAHVAEGEGVIDHNFLGGLCSLIKFISEVFSRI
ncbi:Inositol polyphosphate multikinase beta [Hibiscus syriacus]|uniref:Inositol polyphosphate multikinase n=1 Tax=Hibiscus syriacus TaxID=106335 RepID=A0A6A2WXD8_HIBSY|nr:inositol polyphosphate multikinase beta-like [Hibiscus syriacus]KAE8659925.1 Inositol polyphosphate multikinase beta [Hibiscus syriacus]